MPMPRKSRSLCLVCSKETKRSGYKYCSNTCQQEFQYKKFIRDWKRGQATGLLSTGVVSGYIKRYLRRKFANKCCLCGWAEINQKTGLVPLVADHIDGSWRNNAESNLRLLCPNCDSLQETYAALNKGRGRENRKKSRRHHEARGLKGKEKSRKKYNELI